jgi:hypothetical protein
MPTRKAEDLLVLLKSGIIAEVYLCLLKEERISLCYAYSYGV